MARLALSFGTLLVCYAAVESATTWLYRRGALEPTSTWVQERVPHGRLEFDPIRGYRLPRVDVRLAAAASNGTIESVGNLRGNDLGFPDSQDFATLGPAGGRPRIAIFGDSYTGAEFLGENWPEKVEALTLAEGRPIELLNLSVSGGGLANWRSVLERIVIARAWRLDAIVFAVHGDDLRRGFFMLDQEPQTDGSSRLVMGSVDGVNLAGLPTTAAQARPSLHPNARWRAVASDQFDSLLEGEWAPGADRAGRFYVAGRIADHLGIVPGRGPRRGDPVADPLPSSSAQLIDAVGHLVRAARRPVIVVFVPGRDQLLRGVTDADRSDAEHFARALGARFLDGALAFAGLDAAEIERDWLPYDGHWGQGGSDRFATHMSHELQRLLQRAEAETQR